MSHLVLKPGTLSLAQLRAISRGKVSLELCDSAVADINTKIGRAHV